MGMSVCRSRGKRGKDGRSEDLCFIQWRFVDGMRYPGFGFGHSYLGNR